MALLLAAPHGARAGDPPSPVLELPIDCDLGRDCFIQQYVDIEPGPEARDYKCGAATYDGHKGTDFRLLSTTAAEQGVFVLAAAGGVVRAVRNDMPDRLVNSPEDRESVKNLKCGNGVVIDHGDRWQTQYCHMARNSVRVSAGQAVSAGDRIGRVGYSGLAQFAHLHLSVRRDTNVVDPFTGFRPDGHCSASADATKTLWSANALKKIAYIPGQIIQTGFVTHPINIQDLEAGGKSLARPGQHAPALIFFARGINLHKGDHLKFLVSGPNGFKVGSVSKALARPKAQYTAFAGKRRRGKPWAAGTYLGEVELLRGERVISRGESSLRLNE